MKHRMTEGTLTVFPAGRLDSVNAGTVEQELRQACDENRPENLIVDAGELRYISSAGLRVLLRLCKAYPDMKVVNLSGDLYEIFEMTGFTEIMTVEKAYRSLNVEGCEVIGYGSNGVVYRYDPDTIVKVYRDPDSLPDILRERELARKAFVKGIPTAISYDVVKVGEGYGSVFELLNAESLAKLLADDTAKLDLCAEKSVDLLKQIHGTVVEKDEMPDAKAVTLARVDFLKDYLPAGQYEKLRGLVEAVPDDCHMLHGDYHIKNVMVQNGETLLIDMDTLSYGNPVFEFASVFLAYVGFGELDHSRTAQFLGIPYTLAGELWRKTLQLYLGTDDEAAIASAAEKAALLGYTRLMRRAVRRGGFDNPEGRELIAHCRTRLGELLARIDTLCLDLQ